MSNQCYKNHIISVNGSKDVCISFKKFPKIDI